MFSYKFKINNFLVTFNKRITRFVFNEEVQVERIANLSEDRFVLEQQGYTISR